MQPCARPPFIRASAFEVRYEIRGALARHARALEAAGHAVLKLNIGNPGRFGFRAPAHLTAAITEHLADSDRYCHEQGLESARDGDRRRHFRITLLPEASEIADVFVRIERGLARMAEEEPAMRVG